jgi:DNA-binding NtrC family response regulator
VKEIAEQLHILRAVRPQEFQRVGETVQRHSRARVITATNRDLRQEVRKGSFRADLYHRLSVFTISVPALRDLAEDKLALLEHFSAFYAEQARVPCFSLSEEARALWQSYPFPGNVRELRNIVIRLSTKHAGRKISAADLEAELDLTPGAPTAATEAPTLTDDPDLLIEQAQRHLQRERGFSLDLMLKSWEQGYVEAAMKLTRGNVSQAAKLLGINRTTLYSRMESFQKEEFSR